MLEKTKVTRPLFYAFNFGKLRRRGYNFIGRFFL
jgi:hypothetical protein